MLRAKQEDLTDIAQLQCIYQSGVDRFGRPVVVFIGRNLPANCIDMERVSKCFWSGIGEKDLSMINMLNRFLDQHRIL